MSVAPFRLALVRFAPLRLASVRSVGPLHEKHTGEILPAEVPASHVPYTEDHALQVLSLIARGGVELVFREIVNEQRPLTLRLRNRHDQVQPVDRRRGRSRESALVTLAPVNRRWRDSIAYSSARERTDISKSAPVRSISRRFAYSSSM